MRCRFLLLIPIALFSIAAQAMPTKSCKDYAARLPNLPMRQCEEAQLHDMQARSVLGRPIWGRDMAVAKPDLRVLVLGGIHGDEMSSSALVFHWIGLAQAEPSLQDMAIHWRFIPTLNPDGMFAKPARRVNAHGVDLNRNFPTPNWTRESRRYWEVRTRRDPRRWPGSQPLSEPESRFLQQQMDSFKPNLIVSVHAPFGVLDFDGPSDPPKKLGRLYLDQVGIYPGSLGNYGGIHKGVPVVTVELPQAARTPQKAEMRQMWLDLLRWTSDKLGPRQMVANRSTGPQTSPR